MLAALSEGVDKPLTLAHDVDLDGPGEGEVLVKVERCGLCHSDMHYLDGTLPSEYPLLLGHEAAGVIEAVGKNVSGLAIGARVALSFRPPCHHCYWCVRGEEALCAEGAKLMNGRYADGGTRLSWRGREVVRGIVLAAFAEYTVVPAACAIPLADDVPFEVAALIGCAVQTGLGAVLNTGKVAAGDTVVVVGLGGVGDSIVQGAVLAGASKIIGVDTVASRREAALKLGATDVLNPADGALAAMVKQLTSGIGADFGFDAVGNVGIVEDLLKATRNGGTTVMVGVPHPKAVVSVRGLIHNAYEKKLVGCYLGSARPHFDIPRAIALWRAGRLDVSGMITSTLPLTDINKAVESMQKGEGLRWMIQP
jgi:S-(hydroxymethyl)glutathione dehydrogenase/alcohol dehydrogenase